MDTDPNNAAAAGLDDFSDALKGVDNTPKPVGETVWEDIGLTDDPKDPKPAPEVLDDIGLTDEPKSAPNDEGQPADPAPSADPANADPAATDPDAPFYDAKRDYADERVAPTLYRDKEAAVTGIIAKITHIEGLRDKLAELGSGLGALDVPEVLGGDWENLDAIADPEVIGAMDDAAIKKAIFEFDKLISAAKTKANTIEQRVNNQRQIEELSERLVESRAEASKALETLDIQYDNRWTDAQLIENARAKVDEFKNNEDYVQEHGLRAYREKVDQLEAAAEAIETFIEVANQEALAKQNSTKNEVRVSAEDITRWYDEFKLDQPDLPMFKAPTDEPETAFLRFFQRKGYKVEGPQSFKKAYVEYQKTMQTVSVQQKAARASQAAQQMAAAEAAKKAAPVIPPIPQPDIAPKQSAADYFEKGLEATIKQAYRAR